MTAILWLCIAALVVAALVTLARAAAVLTALTRVAALGSALHARADSVLEEEVLPLLNASDSLRTASEQLHAQTLLLAARLLPGEEAPRPLNTKALMAAELARIFLDFATGSGRRAKM